MRTRPPRMVTTARSCSAWRYRSSTSAIKAMRCSRRQYRRECRPAPVQGSPPEWPRSLLPGLADSGATRPKSAYRGMMSLPPTTSGRTVMGLSSSRFVFMVHEYTLSLWAASWRRLGCRPRRRRPRLRSHSPQKLPDAAAAGSSPAPALAAAPGGVPTSAQKSVQAAAGGAPAQALEVAGRSVTLPCLVAPPNSEPLWGQVLLEVLDLVVDCPGRRLPPNPASPIRPSLKLK